MNASSGFPPLRINVLGRPIPSSQWTWAPGTMKDYDLILMLEGKGTYFGGGESWPVAPGSCMLYRPGDDYQGVQDPDRPVAMIFIHFDVLDRKKRPSLDMPENFLPMHFKVEQFEFVRMLAQRVLETYRHPAIPDEVGESAQWLRTLLLELGRQARRPRWQGLEREQSEAVDRLCQEIRDRVGEPWRLADIAGRLGCGPEHAGRLFRKYRGVSPGEYVIQARIEAARALLDASSLSIGQIAETLGFCDIYALSRQFKAKTGLSPRAFRQR
ncbi:MAG: helix-turn-helix domain-containing protein [Puniceicoccales bacterium]